MPAYASRPALRIPFCSICCSSRTASRIPFKIARRRSRSSTDASSSSENDSVGRSERDLISMSWAATTRNSASSSGSGDWYDLTYVRYSSATRAREISEIGSFSPSISSSRSSSGPSNLSCFKTNIMIPLYPTNKKHPIPAPCSGLKSCYTYDRKYSKILNKSASEKMKELFQMQFVINRLCHNLPNIRTHLK